MEQKKVIKQRKASKQDKYLSVRLVLFLKKHLNIT